MKLTVREQQPTFYDLPESAAFVLADCPDGLWFKLRKRDCTANKNALHVDSVEVLWLSPVTEVAPVDLAEVIVWKHG